jgi:acyl-CoA thioester hydrolase
MARIKIELPSNFAFTCNIPVRITDLNYGGHVGNDTILTLIHESRVQYLAQIGYSEMKFEGAGMIMSDAALEFKSELFYGDTVIVSVAAGDFSKIGFSFYYRLEKNESGKKRLVAIAKTGMICYDYEKKKIVALPVEARSKLSLVI